MITFPQFKSLFNNFDESLYTYLVGQMYMNEIIGELRESYFLSQMAHESNRFKALVENMNYSAKGLLTTFPKYFKTQEMANFYARQPEKIANYVYAGRMGNGAPESGDGWKFRARGFIHTTGRYKYRLASKYAGIDLVSNPEKLQEPMNAAIVACRDWHDSGLNELADKKDFRAVTKVINGGYNGYQSRLNWLYKIQKFMETQKNVA